MLALAGCDTPVAATPTAGSQVTLAKRTAPKSSTTIEVGVVLAGQTGYLCLPLEQVGLPAQAQIVSLSSSCECIQPRLVKYFDSQDSMSPAIMLEYVGAGAEVGGDSVAREPQRTVANLGVIIEATLTDDVKYEFTVTMLHSYMAAEVSL